MGVVHPGQVGLGVIAFPLTAADLIVASNIWPGHFAYATPLERILTDQATANLLGMRIR